ncbi:MAG: GH116 family glycosyl hydrolase [Mangrovibacterium sp.]
MKQKFYTKTRREFLKNSAAAGAFMAVPFAATATTAIDPGEKLSSDLRTEKDRLQGRRSFNGVYSGKYLNRVAFPVGGMGAGMFCLEGTGAISHMSVRHKPEIFNEPNMFAAISVKGIEKGAKVIEGSVPEWKKFGRPGSGTGHQGANYGLPRFEKAEFTARFPFGIIDLRDDDLPVDVRITGWSPFIPTDADISCLPVGAIEYTFKNKGNKSVDAVFSFNSENFIRQGGNKGRIKKITNGFVLTQEATPENPSLEGEFAIFTDDPNTVVDYCWFRGGWFDPITMVWNTIEKGRMNSNDPVDGDSPGASLFVPLNLEPDEERTIRVMMAWYVPESDLHIGEAVKEEKCDPEAGCCPSPDILGLPGESYSGSTYKPWYSRKFSSISEVAGYWKENYKTLYEKSEIFTESFYASTLPSEVMEAVAANLTILKSPTVLRQYDGRLWNWEGCGDNSGSCHGSCTHVWNYAQAISHLFPSLERSLRHTEFCENQNPEGHQTFRANIPISPARHTFHSAADGQLGGIMKIYREWRISGDTAWLRKLYPMVKKSMDYCIRTWDPRNKGILEEPHHNTYDIEFWGPDGMCTSFYLGALTAFVEMSKALKEPFQHYQKLAANGRKYMEEYLFNGEYFIQKIQWTGLNSPDPVELSRTSWSSDYSSEEALSLLQKEGPKYQYGNGCLSDGVLGVWIARMCGLENPVDGKKVSGHLKSVHQYNLKKDLSDHVNPQRPGYAFGHEGGLLLCSWPKGGKLSLPFVYSNEVWTGIEYQVASHLMLTGSVEEGLEIVRTCRERYDGRVRNPFNEYECGHWYARSMASYGMLQGLTGIRYDAVDKTLYMDSKVGSNFTSFLSTETGFGNVGLKDGQPVINVKLGEIDIKQISVSGKMKKV